MIKAVVFDLDHTLFDRYGTIRKMVPELRECFDLNDGVTDEVFADELCYGDKHFVHKGWEGIREHLISKNIFKTVPDFPEYEKIMLSHFEKTAVKYDFANPVLSELKQSGYKVGLITNGDSELQRKKLAMLDLCDSFDEIIVSGETDYDKPQKEIFLMMAEKLNIELSEMMYVGDHPLNDIYGARNAGCVPVWVKTTGEWIFPEIPKPELQVETVEEIPSLLKKINVG